MFSNASARRFTRGPAIARRPAPKEVRAARNSSDLYRTSLPSRTAYILGEEQGGVSDSALAAASSSLTIAGSGLVDSLNVSVAAALLSAEYWRQHQLGDGSKAVAKPAKAKAVKAEPVAKASKAPAKAKMVRIMWFAPAAGYGPPKVRADPLRPRRKNRA